MRKKTKVEVVDTPQKNQPVKREKGWLVIMAAVFLLLMGGAQIFSQQVSELMSRTVLGFTVQSVLGGLAVIIALDVLLADK